MKTWAKCIAGDAGAGEPARLVSCGHGSGGGDRVLWRHDKTTHQLINVKSGLCLDALKKPPHKREPALLSNCDANAEFQKWKISEIGVGTECTQDWCKMLNTKKKGKDVKV
jgi:hypothetical protein